MSSMFEKASHKLSWLFSNLVKRYQTQKLKAKVTKTKLNGQKYHYTTTPKITFILQLFNKRHNIKSILDALRLVNAEEIIVIDDGSVDNSYIDLMKYLNRKNDFILRCNDLYEVRTYDRAIRMARGEFVCLLQDDDIPPCSDTWVKNVLNLFESHPKLLILGGRNSLEILIPDSLKLGLTSDYKLSEGIGQRLGICKFRLFSEPLYRENVNKLPFMFSMVVNRAPVFMRRKEFLEIGGINQEFAPYQNDDTDYCIRAWLAGYKVGFYPMSFTGKDESGMHLFNKSGVFEQDELNWKKIYNYYYDQISSGQLQNYVDAANQELQPIINNFE